MSKGRGSVGCLIPTTFLFALVANINWNVVESRQLINKWEPGLKKRLRHLTNTSGLRPERLLHLTGDQTPAMRIVPDGIDQDRCVLLEHVDSSSFWKSSIYVTAEVGLDGNVKAIHAHTVRAMF